MRKICHLIIYEALLCDYSLLTVIETGVDLYASPFAYHPPEAVIFKNDRITIVNDYSYDVYSASFLSLKLFVNQAVLHKRYDLK